MDGILLVGLLALVFIGLPIGFGWIILFVSKKLGFPRTGRYSILILGLAALAIVLLTVFEDRLFTKTNARELVKEQGLVLVDSFDLKRNKSVSAIGDYYHTFSLEISNRDKLTAIGEIKNSRNFKKTGGPTLDLLSVTASRHTGYEQTQNYETESAYTREYFKSNGQGYAPVFRRISISKRSNELIFEEINE